ncbi:hypothetical protein GOODEAATRI_014409 [Goodea atripinnis]|uniref:Uncharacterized protein n=1 Tax=Goodea atripinnis TaxID=208336 RepID=A0ABV0NAP1_9TELE
MKRESCRNVCSFIKPLLSRRDFSGAPSQSEKEVAVPGSKLLPGHDLLFQVSQRDVRPVKNHRVVAEFGGELIMNMSHAENKLNARFWSVMKLGSWLSISFDSTCKCFRGEGGLTDVSSSLAKSVGGLPLTS